uniref:Cation-transporting ATPase n=1 Tax=Arion vulgaris TaxID=1028688 RepID=A0A0B6ZE45_9EUPU
MKKEATFSLDEGGLGSQEKGTGNRAPNMKPGCHYVNAGEDDQMVIVGYRRNMAKYIATCIGYLLTITLLRLFFYWMSHWMLFSSHTECSLPDAEKVLLRDQYGQYFVSTVETITKEGTRVKLKHPKKHYFTKNQDIFNYNAHKDSGLIRYFVCKKIKYIWNSERGEFYPLRGLDEGYRLSYFHNTKGLDQNEHIIRGVLYGRNAIAVHVTPIIVLLCRQLLSPFYIFQLFSMIVWYVDEYNIYASCIFLMTSLSITVTIHQTRKFERALRNTITSKSTTSVCRGDGDFQDVPSEDLVPGDVIEIPRNGCDMQCDAALITGNCIVNESMLTGESVPVTKTSLPNPTGMKEQHDPELNMKNHSRHILFCGTHVIQTRFYGNQKVKAIVLRTGFATSKGDLVRSIMFPKPVDFKFQRHSYYFVMVLAGIAIMGFIYTIILMVRRGDTPKAIIIRSLDLVTIAVPPALPAALAVGVVFSQSRLQDQNVYCISPRGISISGTINTCCFDKTGTLTEDGLDMHGVVKVEKTKFQPIIKDMDTLGSGPFVACMAACHSLTIIDNKLIGDPLDLIMFDATKWDLEEPGPDETRFDMMTPTIVRPKSNAVHNELGTPDVLYGGDVGIVRQFPFSSSLQRMSVITRSLGAKNFDLYVKGSPEMVASLSKSDSIPTDFHQILQSYTQHGYRVIALAWKSLPTKLNYVRVQRITRDQVENELNFLGLLVMENRLKPQSTPVINQLNEANIRTIMVTGDNMLTALSVAKECQMVNTTDRIILVQAYPPHNGQSDVTLEFVYADDGGAKVEEVFTVDNQRIQIDEDNARFNFALTGKTWAVIRQYCPELLNKIVVRGAVFARMAPDQKGQLVEVLQDVGYYVGMCGDGANDCGALKTAHMGISLSEAEASVASPFTSKTPTIECVPKVIKEGRAALVTSFGVFKYMACYSLTQFTSVLILYWLGNNLTDVEFLYIDLILITTFSITFSRTAPYDELVKERPLVSLISPGPILGMVTQMGLVIAAQTFMFFHVKEQPWFVPYQLNDDENYRCDENAAVFLISMYQYIILAVTFSKGAPFRKSIFSNWLFLLNLLGGLCITVWITMHPTDQIANLIELEILPSIKYRAFFIGVAFINFVLSYAIETFVIDNEVVRNKIAASLSRCLPSSNLKYDWIELEFKKDSSWPPVSNQKVDLAEIFQRLESFNQVSSDAEKEKTTLDDVMESDSDESGSETDKGDADAPKETSLKVESSHSNGEVRSSPKDFGKDNGSFIGDDGNINTSL